ncbi:MAG: hypothetical protein SNJ77_03160 [Cytophagales bacterium]
MMKLLSILILLMFSICSCTSHFSKGIGAHVPKIDSSGTLEIVVKGNFMPELVVAKAYYSISDNIYLGGGYFQNKFPLGEFNFFGFDTRQFSSVINYYSRSPIFSYDLGLGLDVGNTTVMYSNTLSRIRLGRANPPDQQTINFTKPNLNANFYLLKSKDVDVVFTPVVSLFFIPKSRITYFSNDTQNFQKIIIDYQSNENVLLTSDFYMTTRFNFVKNFGMYFQMGAQGIADNRGKINRYHQQESRQQGQFYLIRGMTGFVIYTHLFFNLNLLKKKSVTRSDSENGIFYNC